MQLIFPINDVDEDFVAQLEYAMGFASRDVACYEFAEDRTELRVTVREGGDAAKVRENVEQLVRRYAERKFGLKAVVHYERRRDLAPFDAWKEMVDRRWVTPVGTGHVVLRGLAADLMSLIDDKVERMFAREFKAEREYFPSTILCRTLDRCNHFTSFPEHMDFVAHLREDVDVLKAFSGECGKGGWTPRAHDGRMGDVEFAITPSCCYHAYEAMEGWKLEHPGRCITVTVGCHRYEGASLTTLSRLRAFTMREVIWVGHPEYVKDSRARADDLIVEWEKEWDLDCTLENANDMFFTDDYAVKASFQRQQEAKRELRMTIPQENRSISVFSSNFHSATFGRAFDIRLDGRPAASGCLGWGYERWIYGIVSQFGVEPAKWPDGLCKDLERHRTSRA